jgi:hypothetical protein
MPHFNGGMAVCPFYERESRLSIVCEGDSESRNFGIKFRSEEDKCDWEKKYCLGFFYSQCPMAAALLRQYREHERAFG